MNKEKQIEEMAYEMTHYKGKMCERIERNDCLLKFHTNAFVDCNFCKLAEHLYEQGYRKQSEGCDFCKEGNEKCGTCVRFFDYYEDGGSDRCYTTYRSEKCVFYKPVPHCPKCGAKMRKEDEGK